MNAVYSMLALFVCFASAVYAQNEGGKANQSMKPALVIIDIQNEYLPQMSEQEKKFALHVINGAIWFFRQNNLPIIRVYHSDVRWGPEEGTDNFEYPKTVHIRDTDIKIHKHFPSAFTKTDLDKMLKEKGCNTLFLCGLSATGCVLATYQGCVDRGYNAFMIREGVMSHSVSYTNMIKDICESVSFESMMFFVRSAQ